MIDEQRNGGTNLEKVNASAYAVVELFHQVLQPVSEGLAVSSAQLQFHQLLLTQFEVQISFDAPINA